MLSRATCSYAAGSPRRTRSFHLEHKTMVKDLPAGGKAARALDTCRARLRINKIANLLVCNLLYLAEVARGAGHLACNDGFRAGVS